MFSRVALVSRRPGHTSSSRYAHDQPHSFSVDNPYTGGVHCCVELSNSQSATMIVTNAAKVQKHWALLHLDQRIAIAHNFIKEFEAIRVEVAHDISSMMGKPLVQVNGMVERTKSLINMAPQVLTDEYLPEKQSLWRKIAKEPVGVVLVIAPWNYPLLTAVNSIIPAILAGNSVILKHSWRTPLVAEAFKKAFERAGAPEGLLSVLHATHAVVADVIANPDIGFVAFTGSVGGGRHVYSTVSNKRFIDATLELGGKDPAYVAPDADIDAAADSLVDGAFYNAGQSCCGIERIYVIRSKYDEFVSKSLKLVNAYVLGDPLKSTTTLGPVALPTSVDFLKKQVDEAKAKGAKLLCGGHPTHDTAGFGRFFAPSLLVDCNHSMSIMVEESFGPVLSVMPVNSEEEAIKLMNDSPYGLTAAIYTTDIERAKAMGPKLEAGTIFMNRCDYLDPELPWSGVKNTGKGVSLSSHGFRGVTRLKSYNFRLHE